MNKFLTLSFAFTLLIINYSKSQNSPSWPSTGNVGIGTVNPLSPLQVDFGTTSINGVRFGKVQNSEYSTYNFGVGPTWQEFSLFGENSTDRFAMGASTTQTYSYGKNNNGLEFFKFGNLQSSGLSFLHMPLQNSRIVISGYGDYLDHEGHKFIVKNGSALIEGDSFVEGGLGIGTRNFSDGNDTYKLSVKGKVRADEVKVYTSWADFVFEPDYELKPLDQVEEFIEENGHLEDIPSEKEVKENGIQLGEMNKLLLMKIEELTLHVIELNKEIQQLKSN